ncbi:MAG: zinc-dependent peptidase [Planctomycetaceae bacterium]
MFLSWFRNRRRRRMTAEPFPEPWNQIIAANVRHVACLPLEQQQRLRQFIRIFVAEKVWEGLQGFCITPEIQVTIAAQAGLLSMGKTQTYFEHVLSILVYPDEYLRREQDQSPYGIVTERRTRMLGEAEWRGPVYLSWVDVLDGGRREVPGQNLVLHEFAHQLDMLNGRFADGIPPLNSRSDLQQWLEVCEPEYQALQKRCEQRQPGVIDCYGAQNSAEFFAVLTEAFFENARALRQQHPVCYDLLADYYQLDPAEWNIQH